MSTVHRFLKMLTLLPCNGEKISVKKLEERLNDEGFEVTARTIQRDLKSMR